MLREIGNSSLKLCKKHSRDYYWMSIGGYEEEKIFNQRLGSE